MAEQKRTTETQDEKLRRQEIKQEAAAREAARQAAFAASGGGPVGPPDDISIQAVAARLGDTRFQTAQRQAMAARIRRVSGNRFLQRTVAQARGREPVADTRSTWPQQAAVARDAEGTPEGTAANQRAALRPVAGDVVSPAPGQAGASTEPGFAHDVSRVRTHSVTPYNTPQSVIQRGGPGEEGEYLQGLMLQTKQSENPAKSPPSRNQAPVLPRTGPVNITQSTLPHGQIQQTYRIPFTQVISRLEADDSEVEEGQTEQEEPIFISEISSPVETEPSSLNSVNSTLTHVPSIGRGGIAVGPNFGICGATIQLLNVTIAPSLGTLIDSGTYTVTGDFIHEIHWEILSGTGPSGQVDIQDENDSDIEACNYQLVAKDLTPGGNNIEPWNHFWAEDITERHELFHTRQRESSFGPDCNTAMQNWLNGQTATSATEIRDTLLPQAVTEGVTVYNALAAAPTTEGDAYADGAPLSRARADAIKAKGDAGDYGQVSAQVTVHPRGGEPYEIVRGDTLWGIAERTYGHGRYWREIRRANRDKVRDGGNLIFPGTILDLPTVNVDQEVYLALTHGAGMYMTETVLVAGGGSHEFFVPASDIFSDTTNSVGDVAVEVLDADSNSLLTTVWSLPGPATNSDGKYEVTASIVP